MARAVAATAEGGGAELDRAAEELGGLGFRVWSAELSARAADAWAAEGEQRAATASQRTSDRERSRLPPVQTPRPGPGPERRAAHTRRERGDRLDRRSRRQQQRHRVPAAPLGANGRDPPAPHLPQARHRGSGRAGRGHRVGPPPPRPGPTPADPDQPGSRSRTRAVDGVLDLRHGLLGDVHGGRHPVLVDGGGPGPATDPDRPVDLGRGRRSVAARPDRTSGRRPARAPAPRRRDASDLGSARPRPARPPPARRSRSRRGLASREGRPPSPHPGPIAARPAPGDPRPPARGRGPPGAGGGGAGRHRSRSVAACRGWPRGRCAVGAGRPGWPTTVAGPPGGRRTGPG